MPEQPSSQAQESQSDSLLQEPESSGLFTMIYIDQSYRAYYNYHNSQNQTTTETINSNNVSSTQARNSSLNGDARWTFRTDRNPSPFNSTASTQYFPSSPLTPNADQGHPIYTSTRPGSSRSPQYPQASSPMAEFPSPVVESTDPDWVGPGTSQRHRGPSTSLGFESDSIGHYHATNLGRSQHAPPANGVLASLPFFILWLVAWFRGPTGTSTNYGSPSDGVV
ncbi:hypothetical protein H1R20_g9131, partial [Candolleomyces eurysporus]